MGGGHPFLSKNISSLFYFQVQYIARFMPPTLEKLRGHIGLGLSVRPSVTLYGSWETQEPLMLEP